MLEINAEWILDLRKTKLGLTQEEFAKRIGVNHSTICHWENGIRTPSGSAKMLLIQLYAQTELEGKEKISS